MYVPGFIFGSQMAYINVLALIVNSLAFLIDTLQMLNEFKNLNLFIKEVKVNFYISNNSNCSQDDNNDDGSNIVGLVAGQ